MCATSEDFHKNLTNSRLLPYGGRRYYQYNQDDFYTLVFIGFFSNDNLHVNKEKIF